jgi:signal transduction histidine kinase
MGVALLRIDQALSENRVCRVIKLKSACNDNLPMVQNAVQNALQEIRVIATGLGLPQLDRLTLTEIIAKVVRAHEQFTGTKVNVSTGNLPDQTELPIKITVYRIIQEALHNAHHHAGGVGQHVSVTFAQNLLQVEVSDQGSGFDLTRPIDGTEHLGLAGMRERVESIGGTFRVESRINEGTKIIAQLFLQNVGELING